MWSACCSSCEKDKTPQDVLPTSLALGNADNEEGEKEVMQMVKDLAPTEESGIIETGFFYDVKLDRQGLSGLGLQLEATDPRYCLVAGVKEEGLVEMWNKQQTVDGPQVIPFDRLVKVNGISHPSSVLITKACAFGQLVLTFQRPRMFKVAMQKRNTWGLDITASENGLTIMAVQDGTIQEWNDFHPERLVQVGDRIVSVVAKRTSTHEATRKTAIYTGEGSVSDCLLETLQSRNIEGPVTMTIMSWACGDDIDEGNKY